MTTFLVFPSCARELKFVVMMLPIDFPKTIPPTCFGKTVICWLWKLLPKPRPPRSRCREFPGASRRADTRWCSAESLGVICDRSPFNLWSRTLQLHKSDRNIAGGVKEEAGWLVAVWLPRGETPSRLCVRLWPLSVFVFTKQMSRDPGWGLGTGDVYISIFPPSFTPGFSFTKKKNRGKRKDSNCKERSWTFWVSAPRGTLWFDATEEWAMQWT